MRPLTNGTAKEKKHKKQSKEQAALGIFAGDSDDDDSNHRPSFGRGASKSAGGRVEYVPTIIVFIFLVLKFHASLSHFANHNGYYPTSYSKPMMFVSSGVVDPNNKNKPIEKSQVTEEDDEAAVDRLWNQRHRGGLGEWSPAASGEADDDGDVMDIDEGDSMPQSKRRKLTENSSDIGQPAPVATSQKKKKKAPRAPPPPSAAVGAWERHTKGIGAKLLKAMGWQEGKGLGPQLQGISAPIEARLRGDKEGLTEGEYKGAALQRWASSGEEGSGDEGDDQVDDGEQADAEPGWKKGAARPAKKPKAKYVTAADIAATAANAAAAVPKQLIVDMRGPQVRVLDSMNQAVRDVADSVSGPPREKFVPELQFNISKLVDQKAARMHMLDVKRRHEEQQLAALRREEASLQHRMESQDSLVARLQDIQKILIGCRDRLASEAGGLTLDFVAKVFELLKGKFAHEYRKFHLEAIGYSLVFPLLSRKLKEWNPLTHPNYGVDMLKSWKRIFSAEEEEDGRDAMEMDDAEFEDDFFGRKRPTAVSDPAHGEFDLFRRLLHEVVLPKLRATIMVDWNPKDPAPLLAVLVSWSPLLVGPFMDILISSAILPRLQAAVDAWDPRKDTIPIHTWVLPWLRFLSAGDQVRATLFDPIQRKLSQALSAWQATDRSALLLLKPWHSVFEDGSWERLLLKSIIPKLLDAMRNKFTIDPANQDLSVLQAVFSWLDVCPVVHFVTLMDLEFFPKFFNILHAWLTSEDPDFDEISGWYSSWKRVFPDPLQAEQRIGQQFGFALQMMNSALSADSPDQILPAPPAPQVTALSFAPSRARMKSTLAAQNQVATTEQSGAKSNSSAQTKKRTVTTFMDTVSLKELLEQMASEHNILFMPIANKLNGGKPVYKLGSTQVWFDKDLVHKWDGSSWAPVHIDDLIEDASSS